jgi:Mor family transcriptional regulator
METYEISKETQRNMELYNHVNGTKIREVARKFTKIMPETRDNAHLYIR